MSGGGKTQTATQQVSIPPEVMARYNAVNKRAEQAAAQPFQAYSYDPNAFVAPLTQTQQAAINNINQTAGMTQPFFQTAAGLTMGGAQGVGPLTQEQIAYYQNPFTQSVVSSTLANLQQQQGQQLSQQQAEAIRAGAFGGDRANIQRAQLQGQQGLATAQAISPLMMQGYQQGVQTAMGQQGVLAQDLQRQLAAGQQLGGLGVSAQQAALAGAQAQLGAGTAEQQTQQAGLQALYNQFLQERGYPFQVAQFLANIAMGTGALSGSTTTTTQPAPFFSDEREKTNIQPLGDGLYAYDYKDDVRRAEEEGRPMPPKRVGPMAQDIEERAPGLVGDVNGHKVVGMNSMGGLVAGPGAYAAGGQVVDPSDMQSILAAVGAPLQFYGGKGLYGGADKGGVGAAGYVPGGQMATPKLITAGGLPQQRQGGLREAAETGQQIAGLAKLGKEGFSAAKSFASGLSGGERSKSSGPMSLAGDIGSLPRDPSLDLSQLVDPKLAYRGGLMRHHRDLGGALPYATSEMGKDPLQDIGDDEGHKYEMLKPAPLPQQQGSGLGDIVNLAKTAASIYALSDARMKDNVEQVGELYDGQPVYRYNMKGSPKTQLGLMAQDLERNGHSDAVAGLGGLKMVDYKRATDVAAGLAPRQGYEDGGTIRFEELDPPMPPRDMRKLDPDALRALTREHARERGLDPNFAEKVFQGESGFRRDAVGDDGSSFGPAQLHYGNMSPKFPRPGLGEVFTRETGLDARDPENARAATVWSLDYAAKNGWKPWTVADKLMRQGEAGGSQRPGGVAPRPITGVLPPEDNPTRSPFATLLGGAFGKDMEPGKKQALTSENLWVPLIAGVGSMLSSRSPYLASAIGEGLVGGAQAYTGLQKQQAETDEAKARTALTGIQAAGAAIKYDAKGFPQYVLVSDGRGGTRMVPFYQVLENMDSFNLSPQTRAEVEEAARRARSQQPEATAPAAAPAAASAPAAPQAAATTRQPPAPDMPATPPPSGVSPQPSVAPPEVPVVRAGAIEIPKEGEYRIDLVPERGGVAEADIRAALPANVNMNNPRAIEAAVNSSANLRDRAEADRQRAEEIRSMARATERNMADLWSLATSVNRISTNSLTGEGAGQEGRAALVNIYNTAAKIAGFPGGQIETGSDISDTEIIRKLSALSSPQVAAQSGFNAAAVANAIGRAMPSGNLTKEAANTIIANMLVELQKDRDFNRYYSAYTRRFGTALNVYDNFNREMGDRYAIEKERLKKAMEAVPIEERVDGRVVTRRESAVEILRRNPAASRRFDSRYEAPGLARYWREN